MVPQAFRILGIGVKTAPGIGLDVVSVNIVAFVATVPAAPVKNLFLVCVEGGRSPGAGGGDSARVAQGHPLVERQRTQIIGLLSSWSIWFQSAANLFGKLL